MYPVGSTLIYADRRIDGCGENNSRCSQLC